MKQKEKESQMQHYLQFQQSLLDQEELISDDFIKNCINFYKNQREKELKAISICWYGYLTNREIPQEAFDLWNKLSEKSKNVFRNLSTHNT